MVVLTDLPPPSEGVQFTGANTEAMVGKNSVGKGTVYIAESRLSWVNDATGKGFSLEYPHISLHAVSRDLSNFPSEMLYLQLDINLNLDAGGGGDSDASENSGTGDDPYTEVCFIPDDKSVLDDMYKAMTHCQNLHPDSMSDSGSGGGRPPVFGTLPPGRFLWNLGYEDDAPVSGGPVGDEDIGYLNDGENGGGCDEENGEPYDEEGGGHGDGDGREDEPMHE